MTDFKARYYYYTNVNGKEKRVEKEFDSEEEYEKFIKEEKKLNEGLDEPIVERPKFNRIKWEKFEKNINNFLEKNDLDAPSLKKEWNDLFD